MGDLANVRSRPLAEIPCEALKVASYFPSTSDARLNCVLIKPGEGEVAILRAANETDFVQVVCSGHAERELRLPVAAVRWILKRHPEAEMVAVLEREVGVLLRTFSAESTVAVGCVEGDAELSLEMPEIPPDVAGLELLYDRRLVSRILLAFGEAPALEFKPWASGLKVECQAPGWSAMALLAGMERPKPAPDPEWD